MPRRVNKKCQHCALLAVEDAIAQHGAEGDNCWNPENIYGWGYDCHRRRSHYRHRADNNAIRRRQRRAAGRQVHVLPISQSMPLVDEPADEPVQLSAPTIQPVLAAVLVLYRQGKDTPVHAIAAEVWRGNQKVATVEAFHCMGMRGDKVTASIKELLSSLYEQFGISKFEDVIKEVPVTQCPIPNCPIQG
ncbi:MAG: hypothetical protein NW224_17600 [Leptolyngbyaceae cyanobacterium bins.302]|nr:hypothetical protein [Leptolyngbyaceae cyanobacterium bins.302]